MRVKGSVHKFGRDCDTDRIIAPRLLYTDAPAILGAKCFEYEDPDFVRRVRPGDVIVAGDNFGCGSSREHAPIAIKGAGIAVVIAASFARIFFRNALNIGLPVLVCPAAAEALAAGQEVEVDLDTGTIRWGEHAFVADPLPPFRQELVRLGGLMPWVVQELKAREENGPCLP